MDPYAVAEIATAITMGAAIVSAFRQYIRNQEETNELLWKILGLIAEMRGDEDIQDGFRARSGRLLRPRNH